MRRHRSLRAEILLGLDDSDAEKPRPDPVHHDSCGEWVFRLHQPLRNAQSIRWRLAGQLAEDPWDARFDRVALVEKITAIVNASLATFFSSELSHDRGFGNSRLHILERFLCCLQFRIQFAFRAVDLFGKHFFQTRDR
ncbi:hypothetical protein N9Z62_01475, partial [bacterium]|nr:hypothetical protein [bacterium]